MSLLLLLSRSTSAWSSPVSATTLSDAKSGTASGGFDLSGTASGVEVPQAAAAGAYAFAGAATGVRTPQGSSTGTFDFTGTTAGTKTPRGASSGTFDFTGTGGGVRPVTGSASGSYDFTGTATGGRVQQGAASGGYAYTGAATGTRAPQGAASGSYAFAGTAAGVLRTVSAWSAPVVATTPGGTRQGSAAGTYAFGSPADPFLAPTAPILPKVIGATAEFGMWNDVLAGAGTYGLNARRHYPILVTSGMNKSADIEDSVANNRMPVISYKPPTLAGQTEPDTAGLLAGSYDAMIAATRDYLVSLNFPVTVSFWHEPHNEITPADYIAGATKFLDIFGEHPNIAHGPILNGFLLDSVADRVKFEAFIPESLLSRWDFVAVDTYQNGTNAAPGTKLPARAAPALVDMLTLHGHPDMPIGIGEYNGLTPEAIAEAGETFLSTPTLWFALLWIGVANSNGVDWTMSADEWDAFNATKSDTRALGARGAAVGVMPVGGSATGSYAFTGTATGAESPQGTATGGYDLTGTAEGSNGSGATIPRTIPFTIGGSTSPGTGAATGTYDFTGTATGTKTAAGAATGAVSYSGGATGSRMPNGAAVAGFDYSGTSSGTRLPQGAGAGGFDFSGTAQSGATRIGHAAGTYNFAGSAAGTRESRGTSAGTYVFAGSAQGSSARTGQVIGTYVFAGGATGARQSRGTSAGTYTFSGTASGVVIVPPALIDLTVGIGPTRSTAPAIAATRSATPTIAGTRGRRRLTPAPVRTHWTIGPVRKARPPRSGGA